MKLNYKGIIDMEIAKDEASLGVEVLDKILKLEMPVAEHVVVAEPKEIIKEVIKEVKVPVEVVVEKVVEKPVVKEKIVKIPASSELCKPEDSKYIDGPYVGYEFGRFTLVNCTKHPVTILTKDGDVVTLPSSGINTRIVFNFEEVEEEGCQFAKERKMNVIECPKSHPYHLFIVSRIVFDAIPERLDFIVPNTVQAQREGGQVVSVSNFIVRDSYESVCE